MPRFAFVGLHLTGLLFGLGVVGGITTGCAVEGWPAHMLVFTLPGIAVIPDSIAGLRMKGQRRVQTTGTIQP